MPKFLGEYGLYQWFEEHGTELIHVDDIESFRCLFPSCKVFHCIGEEEEYLILAYGSNQFRVKSKLFRPVPQPGRTIGESVFVKSKGKFAAGIICDMVWHFKRNEPFFFVNVDGKKLSKRYWTDDFIAPT